MTTALIVAGGFSFIFFVAGAAVFGILLAFRAKYGHWPNMWDGQ